MNDANFIRKPFFNIEESVDPSYSYALTFNYVFLIQIPREDHHRHSITTLMAAHT